MFKKKVINTLVYNCLYKFFPENEKTFLYNIFIYILLILCIIPLWDSAPAHSHSGKELTPSS